MSGTAAPPRMRIESLLNYFDNKTNMIIPMGRVIRFAIATAMRLEEIFKIKWPDVDFKNRIVVIRDRKDPRRKDGNNQKVPLLNLTGFDAWQLLLEQKILTGGRGRVFPYHHKSAGGPVTELFRSFNLVFCHKGETSWHRSA